MNALTQTKLFSLGIAALSLPLFAGSAAIAQPPIGAVYTMTNATTDNQVYVYPRKLDGSLGTPRKFATNGTGTGTGLGNQSALILDPARRCLYVANAGSNEISAFSLRTGGQTLSFVGKVSSGGLRPISLTINPKQSLLYALNAGGAVGNADNISGFTVKRGCRLTPLSGSTQPLSAANTAPAQVGFSPDGKFLVVTEKATNKINTYAVLASGAIGKPNVQPSAGTTPFGFSFGEGFKLFVSEAAGGAAKAGSVSSYLLRPSGQLKVITTTLATTETATCWVVVSADGRFAYVTNTGSGNLSSLKVGSTGKLSLLESIAGRTGKGSAPIDLALSPDGRNLYVLDNATASISVFRANSATGNLTHLQKVVGLPAGANGMAAQ
jgi:6-phosphogluconolactonase (cycloisomerase 2 family)